MKKFINIFKIKIFIFICFSSFYPFSAKAEIIEITSKEQLLQILEEEEIKPGATVWLRRPAKLHEKYGNTPGLSKLTIIDADILPVIKSIKSSKKQIILFTKDIDGNDVNIILKDSNFYYKVPPFLGLSGTLLHKKDPSKIIPLYTSRRMTALS